MKIPLDVETYKGVDGSSLSSTRCFQIVRVYDMLEKFGNEEISFLGIQELAESQMLFGSTAAKSAIRTFFPLLKKLDFVKYDGTFPANKCFTELGTQFVIVCRAIEKVSAETSRKDEVLAHLIHIKHSLQKQGLINMYNNPAYKSHNMWLALRLFKRFGIIHWNEYLFLLHCKEVGKTIDESLDEIASLKDRIEDFVFVNDKEEPLQNTCYSYLRSFLLEAGLIENINSSRSGVTGEAEEFFHAIQL